ncbi:37S ribosomal protein S9 [Xylariaceae sp. FL0804]|nr:37S ribosomal protein S9 [Xylariaceae sp. FL0804]
MSSLQHSMRCLRGLRACAKQQWPSPSSSAAAPRRARICRSITTTSARSEMSVTTTTQQQPAADAEARLMMSASSEPSGGASGNGGMYRRPMPVSPSYFSRHPTFNDAFVLVQQLARKYAQLPTVLPGQAERVAWKSKVQYRLAVGEQVKGREYTACLTLAKRLQQIHPELMPEEVLYGIRPFKRDINHYLNRPKPIPIDRFGRSHGVGRRKSSVAQAWLVEGTGEVLINGKTLDNAFGRVHDRESALWGLKTMDRIDKYNVFARVGGGGTTGQAEALAMAIAKALIGHEPALKTPLRRAGCITRDPRTVERKKTGLVKARKRPTWVSR